MSFTSLLNYIMYRSGLPPNFRCLFLIEHSETELCCISDLLNGSYYATKFVSLSTDYKLIHFTYVSDELIFILRRI